MGAVTQQGRKRCGKGSLDAAWSAHTCRCAREPAARRYRWRLGYKKITACCRALQPSLLTFSHCGSALLGTRGCRQVYNGLVYDLLACDNDQRPLKLCHSKAPGTADVLHSGPTGTDDSRRDDACADRGFTREDSCGSAKVIGLSCHRVHDAQQVMDFLTRGKRHLRVRSTEVRILG